MIDPQRPSGPQPRIPVCDLKAQLASIEPAIREAMDRVLARGWFVLGEEGARFEEELARFIGAAHAVGVNSGTDAIHLALRAVGVGAGDLVLTTPNSATPTACAIVEAGAVPAFADVDPVTGLLDAAAIETAMHPAVKAIVPVHLYGRCAAMGPILEVAERWGVPVIEDAAQAHGATWQGRCAGTFGAIGCFSFYPSKNLGAYGDAGACVTSEPVLAERLRGLRNYGEIERYRAVHLGFNSRLDELQAAILRAKLPHLAMWNARRRDILAAYRRGLAGPAVVIAPEAGDGEEAPHLCIARVARRDRFREELASRGVATQIHYPIPIHLQEAFAWLGHGPGSFPVAEARAAQIVTLPLYPEMTDENVERVVAAAKEALDGEPHPEEIAC